LNINGLGAPRARKALQINALRLAWFLPPSKSRANLAWHEVCLHPENKNEKK
jgi:hypothetical protein